MNTAVMTDTNSAFTAEEGRRFGIFVLPMPVLIDDKCYSEGQDIDYDGLWQAFSEDREIHTSMPSIGDLMDMWDMILDREGYEELVYIPMSSGLSGSCAAAAAAARDYDGKVAVIDNHRISATLTESVLDAAEMAAAGSSALEIKKRLEEEAFDASIYITVNSLKYLVKSGRVTESASRLAGLLNLKPVLQIQGDKLDSYAKTRGMQSAEEKMISALKKDIENRFRDIPKERLSVATAGTMSDPKECEAWRKKVSEAFPWARVYYRPLSCSIASHIGIGAKGIAVSVINHDREKYIM